MVRMKFVQLVGGLAGGAFLGSISLSVSALFLWPDHFAED